MQVEYQLAEIQPRIFLISCGNQYDLGQLFACVQEYYEGAELWKGKHFERDEYERWYALNVSEDKVFSYPADWSGFNVPSWAIEQFYYDSPHPHTASFYDRMMKTVDRIISDRLGAGQQYYLIGAQSNDLETLDHELAHGLYTTLPEYRRDMDALIAQLTPKVRARVGHVLLEMGYDVSVHDDEIQANFATGLTPYFKGFQRYCPPFIDMFESYRAPLCLDTETIHCDP